jgi:hypothetical protein
MFDKWLHVTKQLVASLFERGTPVETWVFTIVFAVVVILVFKMVSQVFTGNKGRLLFVLVPGFLLPVAAFAAVQVFWRDDSRLILWGAVALCYLLLVIPLTKTFQDTSYLSAFLVWIVTLFAAAAVFYSEGIITGSFEQGAGRGKSMEIHKKQIEDIRKQTGI